MGCGTYKACKTCRQVYYLGYGSYGNSSQRESAFPAHLHEGHETVSWIDDSIYTSDDGHLHVMGSYGSDGGVLIDGYKNYEYITVDRRL